jgi:hypothetical protein
MLRVLKFALFAATILSPIYAQNAPSPAPLPQAMQSAIDRIIAGDGQPRVVLQNPASSTICSAPLLEMHVDRSDRFSMRTTLPASTDDRMPNTHGPAPACEQTGR